MDKISYREQAESLCQEAQDLAKWRKGSWTGYLFGGTVYYNYAKKEERLLDRWVEAAKQRDYQPHPAEDGLVLRKLAKAHKALTGKKLKRIFLEDGHRILNGPDARPLDPAKLRKKSKALGLVAQPAIRSSR